ncbi:hypothetical protein [Streptomyces sp. NPDC051636]|uniref:hypothetical protein n=1 Tax=Streptomyces sp. NPDC051636 TaxID=3365663 RepID=UPI0037A938CE
MPTLGVANARIVTMRELANSASRIMRELNDQNQPAIVTKHGRFVALIQPLEGAQVEAISLRKLALQLPDSDQAQDDAVSGADALRELGLGS